MGTKSVSSESMTLGIQLQTMRKTRVFVFGVCENLDTISAGSVHAGSSFRHSRYGRDKAKLIWLKSLTIKVGPQAGRVCQSRCLSASAVPTLSSRRRRVFPSQLSFDGSRKLLCAEPIHTPPSAVMLRTKRGPCSPYLTSRTPSFTVLSLFRKSSARNHAHPTASSLVGRSTLTKAFFFS